MSNLKLYHKLVEALSQWLPEKRITQIRNKSLVMVGLINGKSVHLSHIVKKWPVEGKLPSLVNRLSRFLNNERVGVRDWYEPVAKEVVARFINQERRMK